MTEPIHSPLGGSSAERWLNCPGSITLLKQLSLPETDEPEYRLLGTAAHEAAARCLKEGIDSWEIVGQMFGAHECDAAMASAVQTYLDYVRPLMEGSSFLIEEAIGGDPATRPHPLFYGTVDFAAYGPEVLDVVDYKHGEGIVVEPDDNPQLKYYAFGILYNRTQRGVAVRSDRLVRLSIVQPRAYHSEGPIRTWETTAGELIHWAENELLPGMAAAEIDTTFDPGPWCRFCPAKLGCPMLSSVFGAAAKADPAAIPNLSLQRLGLEYKAFEAVRFYMKAVEDECLRRAMQGEVASGGKLVQKIAKRVWRDGAAEQFKNKFGGEAMTLPELKTPAEMEKVSPDAKKLVKEWAYTPDNGYSFVLESDRRQAVKPKLMAETFAHVTNGESNG